MKRIFVLAVLGSTCLGSSDAARFCMSLAFTTSSPFAKATTTMLRRPTGSPPRLRLWAVSSPRYGPPSEPHDDADHDILGVGSTILQDPDQLRQEFLQLVYDVILAKDPQHVPSILTKNMPLILSLGGDQGVGIIESIVEETYGLQGHAVGQNVEDAVNTILSFAEDFVQETVQLDQSNKELLGKILKAMSDQSKTAHQREQALDRLLQSSKLSAGFLRHLEGECERIANAPKTTQESLRLLETLRVIQTRVLEELGEQHLGPAAVVLGQLIGYDTKAERLAVLEAGLMVQGTDFGREMYRLTQEALEGFPPNADPGLVTCVQELDDRLQRYLREEVEEDNDDSDGGDNQVEEQGFQ